MLQLNLNPSHATQTSQNTLELSYKKKTCKTSYPEARGPTAQACRDGIRKIQRSDGFETGEECERQQGLHRYSTNKRKTKDRVSSLLNRDGDEVTKCTEKHEVLIAFFALVFTGKISSQVSRTPEARL